jgi:hypothetical protein
LEYYLSTYSGQSGSRSFIYPTEGELSPLKRIALPCIDEIALPNGILFLVSLMLMAGKPERFNND